MTSFQRAKRSRNHDEFMTGVHDVYDPDKYIWPDPKPSDNPNVISVTRDHPQFPLCNDARMTYTNVNGTPTLGIAYGINSTFPNNCTIDIPFENFDWIEQLGESIRTGKYEGVTECVKNLLEYKAPDPIISECRDAISLHCSGLDRAVKVAGLVTVTTPVINPSEGTVKRLHDEGISPPIIVIRQPEDGHVDHAESLARMMKEFEIDNTVLVMSVSEINLVEGPKYCAFSGCITGIDNCFGFEFNPYHPGNAAQQVQGVKVGYRTNQRTHQREISEYELVYMRNFYKFRGVYPVKPPFFRYHWDAFSDLVAPHMRFPNAHWFGSFNLVSTHRIPMKVPVPIFAEYVGVDCFFGPMLPPVRGIDIDHRRFYIHADSAWLYDIEAPESFMNRQMECAVLAPKLGLKQWVWSRVRTHRHDTAMMPHWTRPMVINKVRPQDGAAYNVASVHFATYLREVVPGKVYVKEVTPHNATHLETIDNKRIPIVGCYLREMVVGTVRMIQVYATDTLNEFCCAVERGVYAQIVDFMIPGNPINYRLGTSLSIDAVVHSSMAFYSYTDYIRAVTHSDLRDCTWYVDNEPIADQLDDYEVFEPDPNPVEF